MQISASTMVKSPRDAISVIRNIRRRYSAYISITEKKMPERASKGKVLFGRPICNKFPVSSTTPPRIITWTPGELRPCSRITWISSTVVAAIIATNNTQGKRICQLTSWYKNTVVPSARTTGSGCGR